MKIVIKKVLLLFISASMAACTTTASMQKSDNAEKPCRRVNGICPCPTNTKKHPTSFIIVVLNEKNRPTAALTPTSKVTRLDLNDPNLVLEFIAVNNKATKKEHGAHRNSKICFVSAKESSENSSGYQFSSEKIAVLWRPKERIVFNDNIALEQILSNSPIGIKYKFSIATEASDPEKAVTYLDPRIIIKRR